MAASLLAAATPEDLLIMKAIARRPRDMADIEAILTATPMLDQQRVRKWARAFAEAMEAPEILAGLEAILTRFRSAPQ